MLRFLINVIMAAIVVMGFLVLAAQGIKLYREDPSAIVRARDAAASAAKDAGIILQESYDTVKDSFK